MPSATPQELAAAIIECIDAGARVINLSLALAQPSTKGEQALEEALNQAVRRGVIVVAAAGNQGTLGSSAITRHPWVIPVVACDLRGRPMNESNLGSSIGRRGLSAPGDGVTSLGAEGQAAHAWRNERRRAFCDRCDCAVVVGISGRERGANQTRRHPGFYAATSLGGSAVAGRRGAYQILSTANREEVNRMTDKIESEPFARSGRTPPHRVRLPGFIADEEIGLGDVIKRATSYFGIKPCGGCERRAAALNRWMVFTRWRPR